MKRIYLYISFGILFLTGLQFNSTMAQNKVKVTLHQPPPNQLSVGDVWKISLENLTDSTLYIYLVGSVDKDNSRVVEGTSAGITLLPGKSNYNYRSFETGSVNWYDNTLKEFILRTGNVPAGNYATCMQAFSSNNNIPFSINTCISIPIIRGPTAVINTIFPSDGDSVNADNLTFSWAATSTLLPGDYYRFTLIEMRNGQHCEEAFQSNKPVLKQNNIKTTTFSYHAGLPELKNGKKYAWNIALIRDTGVIMVSPCVNFGIIFRPYQICNFLKINLVKDTLRADSCCYSLNITNNIPTYPRILSRMFQPYIFQISTTADISKMNNMSAGWSQTSQSGPPKIFKWNRTNGKIPATSINVSSFCMPKGSESYIVYSWLNKGGKVICKDSMKIGCISDKPYRIDTVCTSNIVLNGNFIIGNNPGIMPSGSVSNWSKGYGSPSVFNDPNEGCWDIGYIGLSGNKVSGQCIKQSLNTSNKILLGKKYRLTLSIKFVSQNSTTDYVKIRAIAFNGTLPTAPPNHPGPNTNVAIIGISPKIKACADWTVYDFNFWTANYDFDNIAINAENNDNSLLSNAFIDNIQMCDVSDEQSSCNEIPIDAQGIPIIPSNMEPYLHTDCPPEIENVSYVNGNVNDLYSNLCPGFVPGTDTWYNNCPDPCVSVGGTIPDEVTNFNCDDSLKALGIDMTCEEMQELLNKEIEIEEQKIKLKAIEPPIPYPCDSLSRFIPNPNLPFGGRDIVFVHGLKLDHLCDKASSIPGADKEWPDDKSEYYNGYFKNMANETWSDHIWNYLYKRGTLVQPTNRYLVVSYNCNQRLESGANAILSQIRDAMNDGTGVEFSKSDKRGNLCFGRDYVIVSHSAGGLVTDVALSIANQTTVDPILASTWGNLGFINSGLKVHTALQTSLSGSNLAKIFVLAQFSDATSKLVYKAMKDQCRNGQNWIKPEIVNNSILIDLIPEYTKMHWSTFVNTVPVPVLTIAGGHIVAEPGILSSISGFIQNQMHRGNDDGVLSMDCQCGNPTLPSVPTYFTSMSNVKVFDMGLDLQRAIKYFMEQKLFSSLIGNQFNAGCIPFLSPTGMVEPVSNISQNSLDRWNNHYSFIQSTSDHYGGPRGKGADRNAPFVLSNALNTTGYVSPLFDYVNSGGLRNFEESRVITNPYIYTSGLVSNQMINGVYEEVRGLEISFEIWYPAFYNWRLKWVSKTFSFWVWKRKYHLLEGTQWKTECDYVYQHVLR